MTTDIDIQTSIAYQGSEKYPKLRTLSQRELLVFIRLSRGISVSELSRELVLSVKTISTFRSRIMKKTGFKNNIEMAQYAWSVGLVKMEKVGNA